jgi:hypothetical protein
MNELYDKGIEFENKDNEDDQSDGEDVEIDL